MGKLTGAEIRSRLTPPPVEVEIQRGREAAKRADRMLEDQASRPLANRCYLQELAEKGDQEDGRFLTQVLERLADEVRAATFPRPSREQALCLAAIEQAEHWAIAHGRKTNSHVVIDRRIFRTTKETENEQTNSPDGYVQPSG